MGRSEAPAPLARARLSIYCFIAFTVFQILAFLFRPGLYEDAAPGLDLGPHFVASRIIGLREIGLMTVYGCGAASGDPVFFRMTIAGRLTVIPYTLYLLALGAPFGFVAGIFQDVIGAAFTAWALSRDPPAARPISPAASPAEQLLRFALLLGGISELCLGVGALVSPGGHWGSIYIDPSLAVPPLRIGTRSVGFMTGLLGAYQVYLAARRVPGAVYAAWGLHHAIAAVLPWAVGMFAGAEAAAGAAQGELLRYQALLAVVLLPAALVLSRPKTE